MQQRTATPAWVKAIALWQAIVLFAICVACYFYPWVIFGEVAYILMALLPVALFGAAVFAVGILLVAAAFGPSRKVLRIALITAFVFDMQVTVILLALTLQIDNAGLMGSLPAVVSPLMVFLAFAIPSALAVLKLSAKPLAADSAAEVSQRP